jgi:hypothetical protein
MPCVDCQKEVKGTFIRCFECNKKNKESKTAQCCRCCKLIKDNGYRYCYDCNQQKKKNIDESLDE